MEARSTGPKYMPRLATAMLPPREPITGLRPPAVTED